MVGILITHEPTRWVLANAGHWLAGWLAGGLWSLRGVSVGRLTLRAAHPAAEARQGTMSEERSSWGYRRRQGYSQTATRRRASTGLATVFRRLLWRRRQEQTSRAEQSSWSDDNEEQLVREKEKDKARPVRAEGRGVALGVGVETKQSRVN